MRAVLIALACLVPFSSVRAVESIELRDATSPPMGRVVETLVRTGEDFTDGVRIVRGEDVQRLVELATRAPMSTLDVKQAGITREDLDARVRDRCVVLYQCSSAWVDSIAKADLDALLRHPFDLLWLDDGPSTSLTLRVSPTRTITLSSTSQHDFMVPWKISDQHGTHETYDLELARAIARVLPVNAPNRPRISGERLLDRAILDHDHEAFRAKSWLRRLWDRHFSRPGDPDHDDLYSFSTAGERIKTEERPYLADVSFRVLLPRRWLWRYDRKPFDRDEARIARRVRGLRWLEAVFVRGGVWVEYYDHGDLSARAHEAAMRALSPDDQRRLGNALWHAVIIHVEQSLWLLLPDGSRFCAEGECTDGSRCAERGRVSRD